ncbi:hypothetical protein BSLG_000053 [Batrachochytrium salamandrivorans]|nr:hypothetical protein BSLG_000053 [Batrachochytrium salamandrivorans]
MTSSDSFCDATLLETSTCRSDSPTITDSSSVLGDDTADRITLFPPYARIANDGSGDWVLRVTGWLWRTSGKSKRSQFLAGLAKRLVLLGSPSCEASNALFSDRSAGFFAQLLSNIVVRIAIIGPSTAPTGLAMPNGSQASLLSDTEVASLDTNSLQTHTDSYVWDDATTDASGRFCLSTRISKSSIDRINSSSQDIPLRQGVPDPTALLLLAYLPDKQLESRAAATVKLIHPTGVSVISDIDDTIKDSSVFLGKHTAIKVALMEDHKEIVGMADCYNLLNGRLIRIYKSSQQASKGVAFHYLSAAPFQLSLSISSFLHSFSFPLGSVTLRTVAEALSTRKYKVAELTRIFERRKDIDIYYDIDKAYESRVLKVFIRNVTGDTSKLPDLYKRVDCLYGKPHNTDKWKFFINPTDIILDELLMSVISQTPSTLNI